MSPTLALRRGHFRSGKETTKTVQTSSAAACPSVSTYFAPIGLTSRGSAQPDHADLENREGYHDIAERIPVVLLRGSQRQAAKPQRRRHLAVSGELLSAGWRRANRRFSSIP